MHQKLSRRRLIQTGGAFFAASALSPFTPRAFADSDLNIVTTIGQIADPVRNIVGDAGEVTALMGPGTDPHLYNPSAGDIRRLENANVILYAGHHLEGRMGDTLGHLGRTGKVVVAVSETVDESLLIEESENAFDPHLWFDVSIWNQALSAIPPILAELNPEHAEAFEARWNEYSRRLESLDEYVLEEAGRVPDEQRVLVTAHDAFGYFGKRYEFEVHGIQGMSTASEASARDIQDLADFLTDREIPAIFVESSVPHSTVEALRKATDSRRWEVSIGGELYSDAMGNPDTPEGTYEGMVRHNIDTIVNALA